ncbi:hypothetical protein B296_00040898, partial [Ensete ventricosum]
MASPGNALRLEMLQTTCQLASAWLLEKRQLGSTCASLPSRHRHCLRRLRQLSSRICHVPASIAVRIIRLLIRRFLLSTTSCAPTTSRATAPALHSSTSSATTSSTPTATSGPSGAKPTDNYCPFPDPHLGNLTPFLRSQRHQVSYNRPGTGKVGNPHLQAHTSPPVRQ